MTQQDKRPQAPKGQAPKKIRLAIKIPANRACKCSVDCLASEVSSETVELLFKSDSVASESHTLRSPREGAGGKDWSKEIINQLTRSFCKH